LPEEERLELEPAERPRLPARLELDRLLLLELGLEPERLRPDALLLEPLPPRSELLLERSSDWEPPDSPRPRG
jgi:hypothetical protein